MFGAQLDAMMRAGCSLIVGTVDDEGAPQVTRAWSVKVVDDREPRVRFTMSADDRPAVASLQGGMVSLTGADVRTLESLQIKGRVVTVAGPDDDDLTLMAVHSEAFFRSVRSADNLPTEHLKRILPLEVLAVEFVVDEVFDQSPGPGAGAAWREAAS